MWTYIFLALFCGTLVALLLVLSSFTRRIGELERSRAEIEVEEERVFDFLHGLGEAFSEGVRSSELHRLIVESAMRILEAQGGVLYLIDKNDELLTPAYVSKGCPPLVNIPPQVLEQSEGASLALESYIRLHPVRRGEGIIGDCWQNGENVALNGVILDSSTPPQIAPTSALIGPLMYRRKILGVLGLANGPSSTAFTEADLKVFRAIAEQGAFALYNEVVYNEASEKRRLDHDLEIAREIQRILLPSSPPPIPGYMLAGINIPARQVSGDYFDYIPMDDTRMGVAIADVSGKGIPASLIMAMCRSVLRSEAPARMSASDVLRHVNAQLYPDIKEDMFISMAYLILDGAQGEVTMARAGHDAPLFYRAATGEIAKLNPKGMALGIDSGEVFNRVCSDFSFQMEAGDCVLLYTDGATEALDQDGNEFGLERLVQGLQENAARGADHVVRTLAEEVRSFVGSFPQYDDITLIAIAKV